MTQLFLTIISLLTICWCQTIEYATITCVNVEGPKSGDWDDAKSSISCASAGYPAYTLTSCGIYSSWPEIDGAYIDSNDNCIAQQGGGREGTGEYVKARARCCLLDSSINCVARSGSRSATNDDAQSSITCQSNEFMTGCTVYTPYKVMDGAIPDSNQKKCIGYNGNGGGGVDGHARCCSYASNTRYLLELQCYSSRGSLSGTADDATSTISCDTANKYFVAGCSGYRNVPNIEAWFTSGNQCVARNKNGGSGVYAHVICCREKKTWFPTEAPTTDPTTGPSKYPSDNPTKYPTVNPTFDPTQIPSTDPTIDPTADPTVVPTNIPSVPPTKAPTNSPERKLNIIVPTYRPIDYDVEVGIGTTAMQTSVFVDQQWGLAGSGSYSGELMSKYGMHFVLGGIAIGLLCFIILLVICCIKKRRNKDISSDKQIMVSANSAISIVETNTTQMTSIATQPGEQQNIEKVKSMSSEMYGVKSDSEGSVNAEIYDTPTVDRPEIDNGNVFGNTIGNDDDDDDDDDDSYSVSNKDLYGTGNTKGNGNDNHENNNLQ